MRRAKVAVLGRFAIERLVQPHLAAFFGHVFVAEVAGVAQTQVLGDARRTEIKGLEDSIPDFGVVEGRFQITALEYSGNHNGEATYSLSLASAGALEFVAL